MNTAYAYLYDDFLADGQHADFLALLETKLATLGMSGQVARLSMFRNAKEVVDNFVQRGAKTVVAVGDERTLDKLMWFLPNLDTVLGYIPVRAGDKAAELLGIPTGIRAVEILGARLIERLDVGKIGDRYFLTEAAITNTEAVLHVGSEYTLKLVKGGTIYIRNLGSLEQAKDGLLEAVFVPEQAPIGLKERLIGKIGMTKMQHTRIFFKSGELVSQAPMQIEADSFMQSGFKLEVKIAPLSLKVIVGKLGR